MPFPIQAIENCDLGFRGEILLPQPAFITSWPGDALYVVSVQNRNSNEPLSKEQ